MEIVHVVGCCVRCINCIKSSMSTMSIILLMLSWEDGHILRRTLEFEAEGHWKKGSPEWTRKKDVEEESMKVDFSSEDAFCCFK